MNPDWHELELSEPLQHAVLELGHAKPTQVQYTSIPLILEGKDALITSPTGTGKTLAFVLPCLQYLLDFPRRAPGFARILILVPTRELAEQIGQVLEHLCSRVGLSHLVITGGVNYGSHLEAFEKNIDILVATPGRLIDYLAAEQFSAEHLELLVLDEGDKLLEMGFRGAVEQIISEAPVLKQKIFFSATAHHKALDVFAKQGLNDPIRVDIDPPKREKGKIHQWVHIIDDFEHKMAVLQHLLKSYPNRILVFVKKREKVHEVHQELSRQGFNAIFLEGDLPHDVRQRHIDGFRKARTRILVATDVAARGIDIPDVELVINFDMPVKADTYVHRIGRTGRAGNQGTAISLVEAHDAEHLGRIERYLKSGLDRRVIAELKPKFKFPDPKKKKKKKKKK